MAGSRGMVFREALELQQSDRGELAAQLFGSPDPGADNGIEHASLPEIHRPMSDVDPGTVETILWDVVRQRPGRAPGG